MKYYLFRFLFIVLTLTLSCNDEIIKCKDCYLTEHGTQNIRLGNNDISFKYWIGGKSAKSEDEKYALYLKETDLSYILNWVYDFYEIRKSNEIFGIVFYTNKQLYTNTKNLNKENIIGLQIYYKTGESLITEVYRTSANGKLNSIPELTSNVKFLSTNDIYTCSKLFNSSQNGIFLFLTDKKLPKSNNKSNFRLRLKRYLHNKRISQRKLQNDSVPDCWYPCKYHENNARCIAQEKPGGIERWFCIGGCMSSKVDALAGDSLSKRFSIKELYNFKDFALQFPKGKQYVEYYYILSDYYLDKTDIQDAITYIYLGNKIVPNLKYLHTDDSDKIIYNDQTKNKLISVLNSLKKECNGQQVNDILDLIMEDLETYSDKPVSLIKKDLGI